MSNGPINVGDVVQLNSGGAPMTVESYEPATPLSAGNKGFVGERMVRCIWHSADGATQERNFWPHTLVLDAKFADAKKAEQAAAEQRAAQLSKESEATRVANEQKAKQVQAQADAQANRQLQDA